MEVVMNSPEKQLKYSIRKVSIGAASVVIGALYLLMGAGVAHAEGVESAREANRTSSPTDPEQSGTGETGNKPDLSNTDAAASTYNAPVAENPLVASGSAKPRIRSKRELADGNTSNPSNGATGTESGDNQPTGEDSSVLDANRKGETVKEHQPGVIVPKDGEEGANDKNANLRFDVPKKNLTAEELWDIVKNMPDDFQNNERSYLRNMNTLGDALNLKPGEIRELHDFGGWSAIDKEGTKGKFVIGRKNEQGYFTGWYKKEDGTIEQGGMLGGDALDNIYVHEQALDRRFNYMLMLVKGRTRANRDDTVSDNSKYDPRTQNERAGASYDKLPFLEKDTYKKYSPGVVGYNGIEKQFTAFSPDFGSRVRVEFVTGYISDINGSKGTYRVVIKAKNTAGQENTVYDQTIHRVAEIIQNEDLYKKGLNIEQANANILNFLKAEFNFRAIKIRNEKVKANPLLGRTREKDYTPEQRKVYDQIVEEATEEAKKQGDIVMNVTEDFLSITKAGKKDSEWKKTFTNTAQSTAKLSNDLNNLLKNADKDTPNTPTWLSSGSSQAKADDRAYRLLTTLIPGAKKITYHVNDDQLEVETDKYTYTAARNGSKEVGIQGSDIAATLSADVYGADPQTFDRENTNTKANNLNHGWATSSSEEFKHFSHFIGVDKGIERTNVLTDKELSDKIREKLGPGNEKLGKGGYFSTGDVLLGKDIVSYTVQVFSGDDNRVGVNPQSHRVQYNLPILADFSVIQDTVEPSRTVVEKIIPKLNIPPEEKDKITEEIKKKKKTSELAELISGSVKVRYVDEQGNLLSLKNDTGIGEKESDGTYITNKKQLIGTSYNVTDKKLSTISTTNGKHYRAKRDLGENSDPTEGNIVNGVRTITYVYEEREAPTTATVTANYYKEGTQEKLADSVIKADLAIGSEYTTEAKTIEGKTTTEEQEDRVITRTTTYTLVATPENATGTVPEEGATVNYYYRENVEETVVPKTEDVTETKTVTRTIKYVDATDETREVADSVTQTVELTRTNKRNKVTGEVTEGAWSTGTWGSQTSPTVTNYDAPDKATVAEATVTSTTTDTTEVVKYPQATEDVTETKTVTRTIKYVDATDETKEVASPVTQTVELTRTNKRNKVTGEVTEGAWSTGTWGSQTSPTVTNYDAPDKATVAEATVTSTTTDTTEVVKYPQATEDVTETKTVTRTIKYVDATDETKEVASPVTQTVELTRTNKRNKVTGEVTEGAWSTGTWGSQTSPTVTNYDAPDKATVAEATVTSTTTDTTEVVKYPQATEDVTETKTVTRTIKYVDATDETKEVASPVTQTVELTRTNKRNKVTGEVTEGAWSTGTWGSQTSPTVTNYDAPDKATVAEATVTSTTTDTTEVVKYPQATEDVTETKTVTRTIKYVDATDETKEVASPVTQTVELTRTNKRNKVTGEVTEGAWSTGTWGSQTSPTVTNYDAPDKATVAEATVTSTTTDTTEVVKYPQATEDVTETKTVTRTIKYVDATDETKEVASPVTQTVELTRTNKRNKVTGEVTEGAWSTGTWGSQTSPTVTNYDAPDKATVAEATVTSTTTDTTEVVKYPQATEDVTETKTVTRTIKYVDATDETKEVASPVTQTVELTRTNKRNKVTGEVTEGAWSTGTWGSQTSPTVTNYDAPDKATVAEATVTSTTTDTTEVVKYPQATEDVTETKTVTRTIKYVDATDETKEVASPVTQTVELTRTNKRNKVTGEVTEGAWSTGNWEEVVSPEIANYGKPDLPKVSNEEVTADSKDTTILVRYDRLSTPDKPTPEKPEIPNPQGPGTPDVPTPEKPNPQPNPEHPSVPTPNPELPNQETPIPEPTPEPTPEPDTPSSETPVSPDPEVPTYETGKREELPNTGTKANAGLAGAGLLTMLAGLGLGFFKKKENEE